MDFSKLSTTIDSLIKNGVPVRVVFDEATILKMAGAAIVVALIVILAKKYM